MNSQGGGAASEGPVSAPTGRGLGSAAPLIGNVGQEYVQLTLSTNDPVTALTDIQTRAALPDPRCRPLLGLLDTLGASRAEAHRHVTQQAVATILARLPSLSPERLLSLLEDTFPYVTIPELRAVPLAALDRLRPVPATFLKQLASDCEIFWELPLGVQRQAWEWDRKLLRSHAASLVAAYAYETATWLQALNMDEVAPDEDAPAAKTTAAALEDSSDSEMGDGGTAVAMEEDEKQADVQKTQGKVGKGLLPHLARRNLRNGSAALRQLVAMTGPSPTVYRGIVDVITARFRESENAVLGMADTALCALRSQLLMALHDAGEAGITSFDPVHKLAWTLDACLKERQISARRMKELQAFFSPYQKVAQARRAPRGGRRKPRTARSQRGGRGLDDDAESAGVPGAATPDEEDPLRDLGAAGMVLRDPAAFHLLLHEAVRALERCVAAQAVPKEDFDLCFLTQLLSLAAGVRTQLRTGQYDFPDPDLEILDTLYPLIADLILDAELMEMEAEKASADAEVPPAPQDMIFLMVKDEIGRRVAQTYALKRLAAGDLVTGRRVLQALDRCLPCMSALSVPEFGPFAFTLARRVASLLAVGTVVPGDALWREAVQGLLLKLVDAETEVHEEVLRLLLTAAPKMDPAALGRALATTLTNSVRSRNVHAQRTAEEAGLPPPGYGPDGGWGGAGAGAGALSGMLMPLIEEDWWADGEGRGADGVRGTYALFLSKRPELTPATAQELFSYLDETAAAEGEVV